MSELRPAEHRTLCDVVVKSIEDAIFDGVFQPGTRLIEAEIARQLKVSKATVREALLNLERLGLVHSQPRRGTFVTRMNPRHVSEVFSARALLEGHAARLAAREGTEADFRRMSEQIGLIVQTTVPGSRAFAEHDVVFHDLIFEACRHSLLREMWRALRSQVVMVLSLDASLRPDIPLWLPLEAERVHVRVLEALRSGDPDRAERAIVEHMAEGERRLLSRLAPDDPPPPSVTQVDFACLVGTEWEYHHARAGVGREQQGYISSAPALYSKPE